MSIPLSNISLTASEIIENSSLSSALRMNTETVEGVEFTEVGTPDDLYYKLNSLTITDYSGKNRTGNLVNAVLQQTNPIDLNGYSLYFNNAYVYSNSFFLNSIDNHMRVPSWNHDCRHYLDSDLNNRDHLAAFRHRHNSWVLHTRHPYCLSDP